MQLTMKAARVNAGLKQAEAAKEIGVSLSTIKNWESAKSFPKQPMIEKICEVYGVTYDTINFLPAS